MENQTHSHPETQAVTGWRSWTVRRSGRLFSGLTLAGLGGFWLVTNLTDNASLITANPGRVVFPVLVILLGLGVMFTKREAR